MNTNTQERTILHHQANSLKKNASDENVKTIAYHFQQKGFMLDFQRLYSATKTMTYFFSLPPDQYPEIGKINCSELCRILEFALKKRNLSIQISSETREIAIAIPLSTDNYVRLAPFLEVIRKNDFKIPFVLGEDMNGQARVIDLAESCHQLIAGFTGSGKSLFLRSATTAIAATCSPEEINLVLMDGKGLDLNVFNPLRHLVCPVITERHEAMLVLEKLRKELERRKGILKESNHVDIWKFNEDLDMSDNHGQAFLPPILVIIDEVQNLVDSREGLSLLRKLTQQGRACGVIICVATQRPSVDILQGSIKTNFPGRIAFKLSSQVDSRVILDCGGAERLSQPGEFLTMQANHSELIRLSSPYVDDKEIKAILECCREEQEDNYQKNVLIPYNAKQRISHLQIDTSANDETESEEHEIIIQRYARLRAYPEEYVNWLAQQYGDCRWKSQLVYYPFLLGTLTGIFFKKEVFYDFLGHSLVQGLFPFKVISLTRYFQDVENQDIQFDLLAKLRDRPYGLVSDELIKGNTLVISKFQKRGVIQISRNRYRLNNIFKRYPVLKTDLLFSDIPEVGVQQLVNIQKPLYNYEEDLRETLHKVWDAACDKVTTVAIPLYLTMNEYDVSLCHFACVPLQKMVNVNSFLNEKRSILSHV